MYRLHFASRATRELEGCPRDLRENLLRAVEGLARNPRPTGAKKLSGPLRGSYRLRVGSWRVIYDIYDKDRAVLIAKIGPRKSVYRN